MQQKRKEKYRFRKKLSLCDLTNKNTFYKMLHKLAHLRTCKNTAQNIHRTLQKRLINKSKSNERNGCGYFLCRYNVCHQENFSSVEFFIQLYHKNRIIIIATKCPRYFQIIHISSASIVAFCEKNCHYYPDKKGQQVVQKIK